MQALLTFARKYLPDSKTMLWSEETKAEHMALTQPCRIWRFKEILSKTQRTSSSQSTTEGEASCFGPVFSAQGKG